MGNSLETFLLEPRQPSSCLIQGRWAGGPRRGLGSGEAASGAPLGDPADSGDPRSNDLTRHMTGPAA